MIKRIRARAQILILLVVMIMLVSLLFALVQTSFLSNYRQTLKDTARATNRTAINSLYMEINELWYEISVISGIIASSEEVQRYAHRDMALNDILPPARLAVNLARSGTGKIESVIITDFVAPPLFAYGPRDMAVLADAEHIIFTEGRQIFSPTYFTLRMQNDFIPYSINYVNTPEEYPQMYVVIIYNIDSIARIMESVDAQYGTILALFYGNEQLLLSNAALSPEDYPEAIYLFTAYDIRTSDLEVRRLLRMDWQLVAYLDYGRLLSHMQHLERLTLMVNLALAATFIFFIVLIQQQINRPIRQIIRFMENRLKNPQASLSIGVRNEISIVAEGLNHMLDEIYIANQEKLKSQERIYSIELEQKRVENASLMNQINPHFLYNTLNCMRGIALSHAERDIARMIDAMVYIFRYSVKSGASATVREEMQSIRRYMEIVSIRHDGRISVQEDIAPEIEDYLMPKMILQPIVENAVFYGLEPVSRRGSVTIRCRMEGDFLTFVVEDDGKGMGAEELLALQASLEDASASEQAENGHIGMRNIHRRLRLLFDENCGLEIESKEDAGTVVSIRLYPEWPLLL